MTANGRHDDGPLDLSADWDVNGEHVSIPETLIIAPVRGRLRRESFEPGASVTTGAALGRVDRPNGDAAIAITSPTHGVFLGWLAWEGESVLAGALVARIGHGAAGANGASAGRNGSKIKNGKGSKNERESKNGHDA